MNLEISGQTDVGKKRSHNEDSLAFWREGDTGWAIIADGMGGHAAGEVASQMVVNYCRDELARSMTLAPSLEQIDLPLIINQAHQKVKAEAASNPQQKGMGTTVSIAVVSGTQARVAYIGDSRIYLLRDGELAQISSDHTLIQAWIDSGKLTAEEAAQSPYKNVLTQALGTSDTIDIDEIEIEFKKGDILMLCSDGISSVIGADEIRQILAMNISITDKVHGLVSAANDGGGPDNISVILLSL